MSATRAEPGKLGRPATDRPGASITASPLESNGMDATSWEVWRGLTRPSRACPRKA
jgi:hypothetical protein